MAETETETEKGWRTLSQAGSARVEEAGEEAAPRWRVVSDRAAMLLRWAPGGGLRLEGLTGDGPTVDGDAA
ncbi:MAG: hypothetical protein M3Q10_10985, partial [Chloroflexota bacterium]|nr:hypothetical protein [Chloroflexota bacterium]